MGFQLTQIVFWLGLATWFGCVLCTAVAVPVIFRTVRDSNPILPDVLSVNLEGQHGSLLAGTIVFNLLTQLKTFQFASAGLVLVAMLAQLFLIDTSGSNGTAAFVRGLLFLAALATAGFDSLVVAPKLAQHRKDYLDHADEPETATAAKASFDLAYGRSVVALQVLLFCLLGMILFSASIQPKLRGFIHATSAVEKTN